MDVERGLRNTRKKGWK